MKNYVKAVLSKDYQTFNTAVRSKLTEALVKDPRIVEYMETKESLQDAAEKLVKIEEEIKEPELCK